MDDKVTAVLDAYHRRLDEERRLTGADGPPDTASLDKMLLAVGPNTGQLMHVLAGSLAAPNILEIDTSYGYSTIWLADAARNSGGRVTTLELQAYKSAHAREKAVEAGLAEYIDFKVGEAVALIRELPLLFDFVLLDLWKDLYLPCLEAFYPKLNPGAIVVSDNMIFPGGEDVARYGQAVRAKPGMTSILLPVGSGIEVSRLETAR
ncbi:MAG: class I SAM-dependent methyltransferase [Defluviicoccus sp.]|nr:MAG: class I SAM-dependent methyltransferase [Defluviicoccus sp.]